MKAPSVLLIGPYDPHCGEYTFLAPPLGVWRLAGVLESAGVTVQVFDPNCCVEPPDRALERRIRSRPWDIIGVSTTGMTLRFDLELAHLAPITVGFANWVALKLWHRRLYRDHYQSREELPGLHGALYRP